MQDNDILGTVDNTSDLSAAGTEEKKITLDSILREYDAKKVAAEKSASEKDPAEQRFDDFKKELENYKDSQQDDLSDSIDDDMKVVPEEPSLFTEQTVEFSDNASDDTKTKEKMDIMSEISRNFENKSARSESLSETVTEKEEISVGGTDATKEFIPQEKAVSDEVKGATDVSHRRSAQIDEEALRSIFDSNAHSKHDKKRKKDNRNTEIYDFDVDSENTQETDAQEVSRDDSSDYSSSHFDENGERIKRNSQFFMPLMEHTKDSDPHDAFMHLRSKLLTSCLSMIAVFLLMLVSFYTELAPAINLPHIKALEPGKLGIVYILFDLQVLFAAVIFKLNSISRGAAGFFTGNHTAESVAFVTTVVAALHSVVSAFTVSTSATLPLMCSVACFSVFLLAVRDFLRAKTEFVSFRIVSSDSEKYAFKDIAKSDEKTPDEISKFVPEGSVILDIRKTGFIKDFFTKNAKPSSDDANIGIITLISFLISLIAALVFFLFNKGVYEAFCGFVSVFLASLQSCMILSSAYPEYVFAQKAAKRKCAYVGHEMAEEFDNVSVVSFKDTEVFSPREIKVTNIRTYGDARIDNVIVTMARIFATVGGPLSSVFSNSISGFSTEIGEVKIIDVAPDGLWLKVDSENVYVGTLSYMNENNFDTAYESSDDTFRQLNGAILYLACKDRVNAKFYIKYSLNPAFESILKNLYTQGICARIKTVDPCINNDFIRASLRRPECLFSVVKPQNIEEHEKTEPAISASIVSASGENSLIGAFLLVRKMRSAIKLGNAIKLVSVAVGMIISVLMLLGASSIMSPAVLVLLQIFWNIPVILSTKLSEK